MSIHPTLRAGLWVAALLLVVGVLAACGGQPAPAPTAAPVASAPTQAPAPTQPPPTQAPTNTAVPPTATTAPATVAPTLTAAPTTAPATATQAPVAAAPANADNCVKCHTNETMLQKLAKAEEPAEKLSEGEG